MADLGPEETAALILDAQTRSNPEGFLRETGIDLAAFAEVAKALSEFNILSPAAAYQASVETGYRLAQILQERDA